MDKKIEIAVQSSFTNGIENDESSHEIKKWPYLLF